MKINPYLSFDGTCEEAINTYAKILGGEIVAMMIYGDIPIESNVPAEWRKKIAHARLVIGDSVLVASKGACRGDTTSATI